MPKKAPPSEKPPAASKRKTQGKGKPNRPRARWFRRSLIILALLGFMIVAAVCVGYGIWASTFDMEGVKAMPSRSAVYDVDGKIYSRLAGENRIVVPKSQVSDFFIRALLAREDARFYQHRGVDPVGIVRAIVRNLVSGSAQQGASTLTQQLARNSFPERIGSQKSMHRKLLEAFVAARIEQQYKKDEILEHYMNRIYFGSGVYGIEAASLAYFGKKASDLSLGEAAMIAGIIRAPTYSSPFQHPERAVKARDAVLERMVKAGKIGEGAADQAKETRLNLSKRRPLQAQDNYAMDAVARDLNILLTDEQREQGGLKVYTTLDPALQKAAEQALETQLKKIESKGGYGHPKRSEFSEQEKDDEAGTPYLQGAVVMLDNASGGIRALVGGRDYTESKLNRALQAHRPACSTFKPFVYAAAFQKGMLPGALIDDGPIGRGEVRTATNWTPDNSDGTYKGLLRCEEGLIQSRNTMSVRVGERAGLGDVVRTAAAVGIPDVPQQPAIYLGAFETTVAQLTSAFTVFPNNGLRRQSYVIERIDDAAGEVIYRAAHVQAQVIDPAVAWMVTSTLGKVFERGTAATARSLGWTKPAAGKTGTNNDFRDAWFIGYTTSLTCGVWVGFDKPQTIVSRGYGSALALPVWTDIMTDAQPARYPATAFKSPAGLTRTSVCATSNELATAGCERAGAAYALDLPVSHVPSDACHVHRGGALTEADRRSDKTKSSVPQNIFRSFRRFFGGQ